MLRYVHKFDLIWISEVKTGLIVTVPGFDVYSNIDNTNCNRGGIILLVKHRLKPYVSCVDTSEPGQIWINLLCLNTVTLGGCYIPPADSDYADIALFGSLQAKLMTSHDRIPIVVGDLNCRLWNKPELDSLWSNGEGVYTNMVDNNVNGNGRRMLQLCKDTSCVVVNHLTHGGHSYDSDLSFRRRRNWISELDICVASKHAIPFIDDITTNQDMNLPSDHAPLEVILSLADRQYISPDLTLTRSQDLGAYTTDKRNKTYRILTKGPAYGRFHGKWVLEVYGICVNLFNKSEMSVGQNGHF